MKIVGLGGVARLIGLMNDIPLVVATQIGFQGERKAQGKMLGLGIAAVTGAVSAALAFLSFYDAYDRLKDTGPFKASEKMITGLAEFFSSRFTDKSIAQTTVDGTAPVHDRS
jgi:hypothetical protein